MNIERLTVKVHLLAEPCLWCWEIVDGEDGELVESSWATEWTGYASSQEALRAGTLRLTDLARSSRGAPLHGSAYAGSEPKEPDKVLDLPRFHRHLGYVASAAYSRCCSNARGLR